MSIQKFFPKEEFTVVPQEEALDGAVAALKALGTGRSTGLSKADCELLYAQVWQVANVVFSQKEWQHDLTATRENLKGSAIDQLPSHERNLLVYLGELKKKSEAMFGFSWERLQSEGKTGDVVKVRTVIVNATLRSDVGKASQFARAFKRDHVTIRHMRYILHDQFMRDDPKYRKDFEHLCQWWKSLKVDAVDCFTGL